MDPNPTPSKKDAATNLDLMEEVNEKNLYKRMPGFVGLRDETDPIKAESEAMRAALTSGTASPVPQVNGPQRVTGELPRRQLLMAALDGVDDRRVAV